MSMQPYIEAGLLFDGKAPSFLKNTHLVPDVNIPHVANVRNELFLYFARAAAAEVTAFLITWSRTF